MIRYKIITEKDLHSETVTEKLTKFNKLLATFQLIMHSLRYLFKKYYEAIESLSHHCKYQMPHNFNNFLEKTEIMHLLFSKLSSSSEILVSFREVPENNYNLL